MERADRVGVKARQHGCLAPKQEKLMKAKVYVTLKKGVLDPQGKAVGNALESMGYHEVKNLRIGKLIEIELNSSSKEGVENRLKEMCERLLANTVIEDYRVEIE